MKVKKNENESLQATSSPVTSTEQSTIKNSFKVKYNTDHKCEEKFRKSLFETEIKNLRQLHVRSHVSKWLYLAYIEVNA